MKVALISKTNGAFGGASFYAESLGQWLSGSGCEVVHFCVSPRSELRERQKALNCTSFFARVVRHLNWRARRLGVVEPFPCEYWFGLRQVRKSFDVFHFHDLYQTISPGNLVALAKSRPVVFTIHDCSAFTGGCLNPQRCQRFHQTCGRCPQRKDLGRFDFTRSNVKRMRSVARTAGITFLCPSRWILSGARRSLGERTRMEHLPNGFDPDVYRFASRSEARVRLGLPLGARIIAVSCASFENRLKGMPFAIAALRASLDKQPIALLVGQVPADLENQLGPVKHLAPGFVSDRQKLGLYYAAADIILYPSLGDNLPITIQEAMAAATPVLAFDVGGIPELVKHGRTGWLVPVGDQEALNRGLRLALESSETESMGARARTFVTKEYDVRRCLERHLQIYRRAMAVPEASRHDLL